MPQPLIVTSAEAGQKLLQFLVRRFDLPHGVLHRWIRTGQVRINGCRAKAFDRIEEKDEIRVPPFAFNQEDSSSPEKKSDKSAEHTGYDHHFPGTGSNTSPASTPGSLLPPVVAESDELIVFCKPSGLPVHPGSGHSDSLTSRLEACYAGADFMPTPVHRLDRDTSGLLLVGKTYRAVRKLSDALAAHDGYVIKEYLAWVMGDCPWEKPVLLTDYLARRTTQPDGRERVTVRSGHTDSGKEKNASLTVCCLSRKNGASLVLIRLHTGRTHQIRAQLSERGFPLLGDVKYGGPRLAEGLQLHAARLILDGNVYESLPEWKGFRRVTTLPPATFLDNPLPEPRHKKQRAEKFSSIFKKMQDKPFESIKHKKLVHGKDNQHGDKKQNR